MPSGVLSMLKGKARNRCCWDQFLRCWLSSWGSCRSITILESSRLLMIIGARRLLLNLSVESISVESSHQGTISYSLTSRSGPIISYLPDSSDISFSPPLKASSPTRSAEKGTSEAKLSDSSIDDLLWIYIFKKIILFDHYEPINITRPFPPPFKHTDAWYWLGRRKCFDLHLHGASHTNRRGSEVPLIRKSILERVGAVTRK